MEKPRFQVITALGEQTQAGRLGSASRDSQGLGGDDACGLGLQAQAMQGRPLPAMR